MTGLFINKTEFSLKMNGLVINITWQDKNRELTDLNALGVLGSVRMEVITW